MAKICSKRRLVNLFPVYYCVKLRKGQSADLLPFANKKHRELISEVFAEFFIFTFLSYFVVV